MSKIAFFTVRLIIIWSLLNFILFLGFFTDLILLGNDTLVENSKYSAWVNGFFWLLVPLGPIFLVRYWENLEYLKMERVASASLFSKVITLSVSLAGCYTISFIYFIEVHEKISFLRN